MPASGTTAGDQSQPLFRGLLLRNMHFSPETALGEVLNAPDRRDLIHPHERGFEEEGTGTREPGATLGRHWTHDLQYARDLVDYDSDWEDGKGSNAVVLEAEHPGYDAVLDWDRDRREAENTIVPYGARESAMPEVPIRAGSRVRVRAVHTYDQAGEQWVRHPVDVESKA